ncbi:HpcH/HpaI aldolase/citrate lyase family protein [Williamsia soli]|uniref:HpcH/HpaI aldolase/citrate lyase family protein n=1 Tax=Williamsia soli TaxID=364929 RepID=UPI001F2ED006|nr:HpcH/HpaI aldolase/citrate lyase family protein [Williamsia soli]
MAQWSMPGPAILFCPADRPERYAKALSRADAVILDLEDAIKPEARDAARRALIENPIDPDRTIVPINPSGTEDHHADLAAAQIAGTPNCIGPAHGKFAIDSVHIDIADTEGLLAEALDAVNLGYEATACIHPSQVEVVRSAYRPSADEIDWATEVLDAASKSAGGVFRVGGQMIDSPLLGQAKAIMRRA